MTDVLPIRSELLTGASLVARAEDLAREHERDGTARARGRGIGRRLEDNRRALESVYAGIVRAVREERAITPAAEWLIDNFHIVQSQIQDIRDHLPPSYSAGLPKMAAGPFRGQLRVYAIAWSFISHTDSRFDPELLRSFIVGYQSILPLTMGELWAIPITLRLVLIENLRRLGERIVFAQKSRHEADEIANEVLGLTENPARPMDEILAALGRRPFDHPFAVELLQRLRFQDSRFHPVLEWIDRRFARDRLVPDDVVSREHASQAAANVSVRNAITSSRSMSSFNWPDFFEDVSLVEGVLRANPWYGQADFATRDRYRHAVEELARHSDSLEVQIAQLAVERARGRAGQPDPRVHDLGYDLISTGRRELEKRIGFRPTPRIALLRAYQANALALYLGAASLLAAALAWSLGFRGPAFALALFPAGDIALTVVNRLTIALLGPRHLPRLNLDEGVPAPLRTFIAVPTMFTSDDRIDAQVEDLEIHFLSNSDEQFYFALLSDGPDSRDEWTPKDERLLARAAQRVAELNRKHGPTVDGHDRFYVLHRRRLFNERDRRWMGWERKRGKLEEFNRLLRGATDTTFMNADLSAPRLPPDVRYVITLDADTRLPNGAAFQLVGTMGHPLNRPQFDEARKRVVKGYGLLQPRVTPALPSRIDSTIFQNLSTGRNGIDPYASAVSDIYQDLFGEGSFSGKGIYDVETFARATEGRIPENSVLSHDLLEGSLVRCGFLSDVEAFEDFPSHTQVAAARNHRWIRGDWQLLPWIFGRRGRGLSALSRWKMTDNLRRSLTAPATILLMLAGVLAGDARAAAALTVAAAGLPFFLTLIETLWPQRVPWRRLVRLSLEELGLSLQRWLMNLVLLADQAWTSADAIARALWRMSVSRRGLLEWTTAAQAKAAAGRRPRDFIHGMAASILTGLLFILAAACLAPATLALALPAGLIWMGAPLYALWISEPPAERRVESISPDDEADLRRHARRIWHFFTTFVTAEEHHLPPDNFQEDPHPVVAHRSSPTNFGLYLLAVMAARDFGWIGLSEMTDRLSLTLDAMEKLPRHQGHFFNWYETTTARALEPRYISAVDNGNLAGHLLALAQGCRQMKAAARAAPASAQNAIVSLVREAIDAAEAADLLPASFMVAAETALDEAGHSGTAWPARIAAARRLQKLTATTVGAGDDPRLVRLADWTRAMVAEFDSVALDEAGARVPAALAEKLEALAQQCDRIFWSMDFGLLYDPSRRLLSIGYRVADDTLDPSCYDLLASEARLASFLAVAKGDVPASHWFRLGRGLVSVPNGAVLASWSGSMFEYLMPSLVMADPEHSLIEESCRKSVHRQIQYGEQCGVPWGVSEAAYNKRDLQLTYQYTNFGVPGLGLKRGLASNLVIAPYASFLAAMFEPAAATDNLRRLQDLGAGGHYGFFESLDFTPSRLPEGEKFVIIRAFMAHHQGMALISLVNLLEDGIMRRRFHSEPLVQATDLLLQERTPRSAGVDDPGQRAPDVELVREEAGHVTRVYHNVHRPVPNTQILSNGAYSVVVTSAGSGYSRCQDTAVTRWREDVTRDDWGQFIYLRDAESGRVWSAGHQPTGAEPDFHEVVMAEDRVKIRREDLGIACETEILVSSEDNAEVRRVRLTNNDQTAREIEVTSYSEIVLAAQNADVAHPAFSNLFVQTEHLPELNALLATRRPRSAKEKPPWAAHLVVRDRHAEGNVEFDTDRATFIGRGRSVRRPAALEPGAALAGRAGAVLDPVFSLRARVHLEPGASCHLTFYTLVAPTREDAVRLAEKLSNESSYDRIDELAWTQAHVKLHYFNIEPDEGHLYQRLSARLIFLDQSLRAPGTVIARCRRDVTGLWSQGISGDFPLVLARIDDLEDRGLIRQLLKAHAYLNSKGLTFDLVFMNTQGTSYAQDLQDSLVSMVYSSRVATGSENLRGKVFVLRSDLLSEDDRVLLASTARVILSSRQGSLSEQLKRTQFSTEKKIPAERRRAGLASSHERPPRQPELQMDNGLGGFTADGSEYVIHLGPGENTPAPWTNVVTNGKFGFTVSERGGGATWSANSRENQITPWSNDPVCDPPGEAIYLKDVESNHVWSPAPAPIRHPKGAYLVRHGQGFSRFEYSVHEIETELTQFVPLELSVKISRLKIRNLSSRTRRISVTAYVEWVLGFSRGATAPLTVTEKEEGTGALLAWNSRSNEFGARVAFLDIPNRAKTMTGDRSEFIGRNGHLEAPAALFRQAPLSGKTGGGLDPCGAVQTAVEIPAGGEAEVVIVLGQEDNRERALDLLTVLKTASVDQLLAQVRKHWDDLLGKIQVSTPDRAMDLMLNRWLLYQTAACRFWARAAFYQAGGAYGFRDQLQDVMALAVSRPDFARAQILRAAGRQFPEGDVQHWWHPPSGRGVRTHFSDDLVWLPYVVHHYLETTGDRGVLDEPVTFLTGPPLPPDQEDSYFTPGETKETAPLYEHCALTLDRSLAVGAHGLPLIGCGDWNDGMNRVGHEGKGESVWMGWFLILNLRQFAAVAEARGDAERAARWRTHAENLRAAVEAEAWDGDWYRRAYFDDGTPLGSRLSEECRIDSLTQTWAVLSGAAEPARAKHAMESVEQHLVKEADRMILLFTPPFDKTPLDPGYIRGYLPGVRENGGQYTHAAVWCLLAHAALGNGRRAWELFDLLNPIRHSDSPAARELYKAEPYVLAADVYSQGDARGRGGWTWYTGSCGWMYRAGIESILGLRVRGNELTVEPAFPASWPGFSFTYRHGSTTYEVSVSRGPQARNTTILLRDDGGTRRVDVTVP